MCFWEFPPGGGTVRALKSCLNVGHRAVYMVEPGTQSHGAGLKMESSRSPSRCQASRVSSAKS